MWRMFKEKFARFYIYTYITKEHFFFCGNLWTSQIKVGHHSTSINTIELCDYVFTEENTDRFKYAKFFYFDFYISLGPMYVGLI